MEQTTTEVKRTVRTVEQVRARLEFMKNHDPLNLALEDLAVYLPEYIKSDYHRAPISESEGDSRKRIREYLPFAFKKALGHRGLSGDRSVMHLANWAWLGGRDDLAAFALEDGNYRNYGVPILKRFAREYGVAMPKEIEQWPDGGPCTGGCEEGCEREWQSR